MLPQMLRPSPPQQSRKPRPPAPAPSGKLKMPAPQPSGKLRPGASQAESLHRQHAKTIKHLEEQVIQEGGRSQINFLSACQAAYMPALQNSEVHWEPPITY